jgi:hypothetical protein
MLSLMTGCSTDEIRNRHPKKGSLKLRILSQPVRRGGAIYIYRPKVYPLTFMVSCECLDHLIHSKTTVMHSNLTLPNGYRMYIPLGLTFTNSTLCPIT